MLYKFTLICDEIEDFVREITIDADSTFLDLSNAILKSCSYDDSQITNFFLCNDHWEQEVQFVREDIGADNSVDQDIYLMGNSYLRDYIQDEGQKLEYVFDPMADRMFFIKVSEVIFGKNSKKAVCNKSEGKAPKQFEDFSAIITGTKVNDLDTFESDENFYGSEDFNDDEFSNEYYQDVDESEY